MSKIQTTIAGGDDQMALTRKAMEDAAADARHLMVESKVVSTLVSVDIIARQLFLLVRYGIEAEINNGWEVECPALVLQTLGMAAQEKAVSERLNPVLLRQQLLEIVLPTVDIFCKMEHDQNEQRTKSASNSNPTAPISGGDAGTQSELGEVPVGTSSHPVDQTGERGEGDSGKEGKA